MGLIATARNPHEIPWEFADAVEIWCREHGRHGTMVWNPVLRCPDIRMDLKPDDPRLEGWQNGRLKHKPYEHVYLHHQTEIGGPLVAIDLYELGIEGLKERLDRGNLMSGRGEYDNIYNATLAVDAHNLEVEQKMKDTAIENARLRARDNKRRILDQPLVAVPDNLE
jgi:hypothetical protein